MNGRLKDLMKNQGGEWVISFTTTENPVSLFYRLKDHVVSIDIKKASNQRSQNANRYAWVLIDQIAARMGIKATEVYRNAIREIGGICNYYGMKEEAYADFCAIWTKDHLGRQVEIIPGSTKEGWINVRAWKGSSDFDSAQMARLIDSLIQDAEALGIPTIPDKEVERMVAQWGKSLSPSSKGESQGASSADG